MNDGHIQIKTDIKLQYLFLPQVYILLTVSILRSNFAAFNHIIMLRQNQSANCVNLSFFFIIYIT